MRISVGLLLLCLLFAPMAWCQETPNYEVFAGASFAREDITEIKTINALGWHASAAGNANRWLGAVFDFSGQFSSPKFGTTELAKLGVFSLTPIPVHASSFTYLFGPRVSYRKFTHFTPYVEGLVGVATIRFSSEAVGLTNVVSSTTFATALGGGVDITVNRHLAVRLIEADYLLTRFRELGFDPDTFEPTFSGPRRTQNNVRASTGIVFRFGSR